MFDKLLESEPTTANIKSRRNYFLTTSLIVGVFFLSAVIASIYASDFGIGDSSIEITEMLAPVEMAAPENKPRPQAPAAPTQTKSDLPTRTENMARVDEPTIVPSTISSAKNTVASRPDGRFKLGPVDSNVGSPTGYSGPARGPGSEVVGRLSDGNDNETELVESNTKTPPPVSKPKPPVSRAPMSGGVVNGKASSLPKPNYSAAAKAIKAGGEVKVQVTIDEAGRVISASAISGHQLLRGDAERAARNARFSPTLLTGTPVKVTGVIIYNFVM